MIGIFSRTTELYDALANETRLSILILLRAKKEMDSKDLRDYLREKSIETLEHHLNILERAKLIQKRDSSYSLTKEGERRLSELGVTESEAIELTREREILIESISQNDDWIMGGKNEGGSHFIQLFEQLDNFATHH